MMEVWSLQLLLHPGCFAEQEQSDPLQHRQLVENLHQSMN